MFDWEDDEMYENQPGSFKTPLICRNGHVLTSSLETTPEAKADFCSECGSSTISKCEHCSEVIRGYHELGYISGEYTRPLYCHKCGHGYPWALERIKSAKEYTDSLDELSTTEKKLLKEDIDGIVHNTPQSTLAASRFKKLVTKAGTEASSMLRDLLVDIVSEAIKKQIWP